LGTPEADGPVPIATGPDLGEVVILQDGRAVPEVMEWGLVHKNWARPLAECPRPRNARAETLLQKQYFREATTNTRCLIIMPGFHEKKIARGEEHWYYIRRTDGERFNLAGIWAHWEAPDGSAVIRSFAAVTCEPSELVRPYHDRMPVILGPLEQATWLLTPPEAVREALAVLQPYDSPEFVAYPVADKDSTDLLDPLGLFTDA
jgi:putative SOS response-associated peptidase YedK